PRSLRHEAGGQVHEAAKAGPAASHGLGGETVARKPVEEARERDLRLEPREVEARTGMDAEGERDMPVRLAFQVENVRIAKLRRIAVGRTDGDGDPCFGRQCDTSDDDLARGYPIAQLNRTLEAQKLLDRGS